MADDLVAFLRARLTDDERGVHEWTRQPADGLLTSSLRPIHEWVQRDGAVRVLREVAAKRQIMAIHHRADSEGYWSLSEPACSGCGATFQEEYRVDDINECPVLRSLASIYADHPDYRDEWRP